jgi:SEC-C motif-containing protein
MQPELMPTDNCPCGTQKTYSDCCQPFHLNKQPAPTAEALMRSRYSAFALSEVDYLINTHHPSTRSTDDRQLLLSTINSTRWLNLDIIDCKQGQLTDSTGTVEFIATFKEGEQLGQMHEVSRFVKENNQWFYVDGDVENKSPPKPGRNDPCWCDSGKKFKKCHG